MRALWISLMLGCLSAVAYGQRVVSDKNQNYLDLQQITNGKSNLANAFIEGGFDKIRLEQLTSGTLIAYTFFSTYLKEERTMYIYVPTCNDTSGCENKRYPVVYFLHSSGFGQYGSLPLALLANFGSSTLDGLIADGKISPMIVVFPDGSEPHFGGSFYTDSELYGAFEGHIAFEVVNIIDSEFPSKPNRMRRGIMGHSMGGYGAMKLAFNHTYKYRAVASHSGPLDLSLLPTLRDSVLAEYNGPPYDYDPDAGRISELLFQMAGAFSPNRFNPPYFVDLPLDNQGNFIEAVFNKWLKHNPAHLAKNIRSGPELAIYFDVGMKDELGLFPLNEAFRDSLLALNIKFDYRPYEGGGHFDPFVLIDRVSDHSITFMDSVLHLGCDNTTAAMIPKQLAALDLDPTDLALEYEDRIYDEYRTEVGNIFAVLAQSPQIQFDLYHFLKASKSLSMAGPKSNAWPKPSRLISSIF